MAENGDEVPSDQGRALLMFYVQLIALILAGLFVAVRAYIKFVMVKLVTLDDYLIFLAMAIYIAYGTIALHGIHYGFIGNSPDQHGLDDFSFMLRNWYLCEILYPPATLAVRLSVCVLLFRLASKRSHTWIIWINLVVVTLISVVFFFMLVFQCWPIQYFWEQVTLEGVMGRLDGSCMPPSAIPAVTVAYGIISALSDWCLGLLPILLLWHVKINARTKAIIAVLLSMGMLAGIAPIVRIFYLSHVEISVEFLVQTVDVALWSIVEPSLGIIAACAATFRPLFKSWGFGWSSSKRTRNTYQEDGSGGTSDNSKVGAGLSHSTKKGDSTVGTKSRASILQDRISQSYAAAFNKRHDLEVSLPDTSLTRSSKSAGFSANDSYLELNDTSPIELKHFGSEKRDLDPERGDAMSPGTAVSNLDELRRAHSTRHYHGEAGAARQAITPWEAEESWIAHNDESDDVQQQPPSSGKRR